MLLNGLYEKAIDFQNGDLLQDEFWKTEDAVFLNS